MAKNIDKIKQEVKSLVSDITEIPEADLAEDAKFTEDLGVDSMMALEIVASIEKKYKTPVPEEKIPNLQSLKDIYDLLEELL
ncbi:MAG: acyl carrier protein [Candidatus Omnitrophica bacterium]|nr:acyl carrier protein [Candidatus Omnitrophota bacterium]